MISLYCRRRSLFLTLVFLSLLIASNGKADIKIVTGEYPPYSSRHLPGGGITTQLILKVFEEMNIRVSVEYLPWKRGYELAERGEYAATFPYLKLPEREQGFLYSEPILIWESRIYSKKNSKVSFNSWHDLAGFRQCLPLGNASHSELDKMYQENLITRVEPVSCWQMILRGRADFILEDKEVAKSQLKLTLKENARDIQPVGKIVSIDKGFLIFSRNHPDHQNLKDEFDRTLSKMIKNGKLPASLLLN